MKRFLLLGLFMVAAWVSAHAEIKPEALWPLPKISAGDNPAVVPAPRMDWVVRFQGNLDRTQGKKFDLIFDGDSITDGWQGSGKEVWAKYFDKFRAANFGISGDKVEHLLWRLEQGQVEGMDPKLIVLMIGTNNTGRDKAEQIAKGIKVLVNDYLKRCPSAHLLLLGVFPRAASAADPVRGKIADINKEIAGLEGERVTYLDIGPKLLEPDGTLSTEIMPDRLHPSARGYEVWAEAILPVVEKYCK
jgi:lysophospholipase L1-like esterase